MKGNVTRKVKLLLVKVEKQAMRALFLALFVAHAAAATPQTVILCNSCDANKGVVDAMRCERLGHSVDAIPFRDAVHVQCNR